MGPPAVQSTLTGILLLSSAVITSAQLTPPTPPIDGWSYNGCYTDQVGKRTLTEGGFNSGSMTNGQCIQFCADKHFAYAGTEYSQECYCGNSLNNGGLIAAAADCNMACNGNANEPCGGPGRLTLYNTTVPAGPVGPFVNPGVNGFRSLGCYLDNVNGRALTVGTGTPGGAQALTISLCTAACLDGGYLFAGTEYSGECYCGNEIANGGAPADSGCDMVCNGNSTEFCGGPNRLNMYTRQTAPTGWTSLGCYAEGTGGRTLTDQRTPAGQLTTESCLTTCHDAGYFYAGTEYGGECYCGNAFQNGGGPAPDGDAGCNMPCNGNSQETCGGPNRLNVYQYGDGPAASSTPAATTTTQPADPNTTQAPEPTTQPSDTPTTTTATTSATAGATGIPDGWNYKGCWVDNANGRILNNENDDNQLTAQSCIARCSSLGYSVAGMEYSFQCFCDDFFRNGATKAAEADCNMPCSGDSKQNCGAGNRLSVYSNNTGDIPVYQPPAVQKTNLTGYWNYTGCLRDDAQTRALPYQIILTKNNTANNCISQCSAFGYSAGGMEYGDECYCGDPSDVAAAGVELVAESDCSFACSGNLTTICGGPRRISYYTWAGPPLAQWSYPTGNAAGEYRFLIGGVVIPLVTQAARNGKVTFLEKAGTGAPNTTGAYELDLAQINNFTGAWRPMHLKTDVFCSGSLTLPDKAARQINVGGWSLESTFGIRLYWPDGSPGVWGKNDWQENVNVVALQNGRWYPSSMIMANGSILVVGGEQGSNGAPMPTLELLPPAGPVVYCDWLNRTDPNNLYPFLAVLPTGGIFVHYYNEAIILDEKTFQIKKQLPNAPGAVNNFLAGRTYPMEGSAMLFPQYPPYTDPLRIIICGGSTPYQGFALDNCVSIAPEEPDAKWTLERMPSRRVLTCMTALPDGTYLILNGAHQGFGGFGLATDPNLQAVLYDPSKPVGQRFSLMASTIVPRMYHSEAILLDDGRVLISGSDPEDDRYAQEYRVEVFIPPYLMGDPVQPVVTLDESQSDWAYSGQYTFQTSQPISKVSIMGAAASTHGNTMGQRTIFLAVNCNGNSCTVTAPPNAHVCPPGWFQLFALNANGVPSKAVWVRVGGDPGDLGSWPDAPEFFNVPGSG